MIFLNIYLLFESLPNAISEVTLYADREFYQDWWNATNIKEFYSKWLKFAYLFFYRHVYVELVLRYKVSPLLATALTSLVSALTQELIIVSIYKGLIFVVCYSQ